MNTGMTATTFAPGPTPNTVRAEDGKIVAVPEGWTLLPPGDAGLTRRVKAAGDHWVVQEKRGRKTFSRGIWTPQETIERIRSELEAERSTEVYARRKEGYSRRRERAQAEYVVDFHGAVLAFLANYLDDSSRKPHMKLTAIDKAFGVAESTGQGKSKAIRTLLKIRTFDPHWTLPSRMGENPMAWMIEVNGFIVDARHLKREFQEEALRKGLIPYIPADRAGEPAGE